MTSEQKVLKFLYLSSTDMEEAIEAARLLKHWRETDMNSDDRGHQRLKALETALIISYARPFTSSDFYVRLSDDDIQHLTPLQKQVHHKICLLRDKRYAHTDSENKSGRDAGFYQNIDEGTKGYYEKYIPLDVDLSDFQEICKCNLLNWRNKADQMDIS